MSLTRRRVLTSLATSACAAAGLSGWRKAGLRMGDLDESRSAYRRYVSAWGRMSTGESVDHREVRALLEHPFTFDERLARFPESPFGVFTSCTPHRDVFHDFLDWGLRWLTAPDSADPALPPMAQRGQAFAWQWSFWGRAAIELYEGTQDRRFLDLLVGAARNVMDARADRHGIVDGNQKRIVKSWDSVITFGGPSMSGSDITVTGLIALPILCLANRLTAEGEEHDDIIRMAQDLAPSFDEFEGYYVDLPEHDAGYYRYAFLPQIVEPINHMNAFAAGLVELYQFGGDSRHLERARKLLNFYRKATVVDRNGAISSPYEQDPAFRKTPKSEYFWKMTVTAELPLALARYGLLITEAEMIGIARTYADVVMNDPAGLNALTRSTETPRLIDFRAPLSQESPEWKSYVPMVAAGLFFVDRDRRIGDKLLAAMVHFPHWFPNGFFSGGGVGLLARAVSLRRGMHL